VLRLGQPYIEVETGKLPPGTVIPDNVPPGHVGVKRRARRNLATSSIIPRKDAKTMSHCI
jgi:hypothetical protein